MYEREPGAPSPEHFWQTEQTIGQLAVDGALTDLHLRTRSISEPYRPSRRREIVPITNSGIRTYTLGQAYILTPELTQLEHWRRLTGQPLPERQRPLEDVRVGDVQSFFYAQDHTLVIWNVLMLPDHRGADPVTDPNLDTLWRGAEAFLLGRFAGVERIVTPSWEPAYERAAYHAFLRSLGYRRISTLAFEKYTAAALDRPTAEHGISAA